MRRLLVPTALLLMLLTASLPASHPRRVNGADRDRIGGEVIAGATFTADGRTVYCDQAAEYNLECIDRALTLTVQIDVYPPREIRAPNGKLPGQLVPLNISSSPNALRGTVRDAETGAQLTGSVVTARELQATADRWGHYALRRIPTGTQLRASMPGYETTTAVFSGQGVQDFALQPIETVIAVLDLYSLQPVPDARIVGSPHHLNTNTDATGTAVLKRLLQGTQLSIEAAGRTAARIVYDGKHTVPVVLRPNTLRGVIKDSSTSEPMRGVAVSILCAERLIASSITEADGRYAFRDLPSSPISLVVSAVDHDRFETEVGPVTEMNVHLERFRVKGIYMPLGILVSEQKVQELIDLVHRTELNAIVVDVKNDRGWLAYPSELAVAQQSGAYRSQVMDISRFLALCRAKDIYVVARVVVFKDSALATSFPEWSVRTETGKVWTDAEGSSWGDPFREEVQDYNIAVAREIAILGFDELQLDYLRFPSDGSVHECRYQQESTLQSRCEAMESFCARLRHELQPYAALLSADLFGLTVWVAPGEDMGIGQRVIDIAPSIDYISPMLYPATFTEGNLGYDDPASHPYDVVRRSCTQLAARTKTRIRPWLQHYRYSVEQMRLQKAAAEDAGTAGWMFWNAAGKYDERVFDPAPGP